MLDATFENQQQMNSEHNQLKIIVSDRIFFQTMLQYEPTNLLFSYCNHFQPFSIASISREGVSNSQYCSIPRMFEYFKKTGGGYKNHVLVVHLWMHNVFYPLHLIRQRARQARIELQQVIHVIHFNLGQIVEWIRHLTGISEGTQFDPWQQLLLQRS